MNHRRFLLTSLAALLGVAAILALRAGGQVPADAPKNPSTIVELGPDNVLSERTFDDRPNRVTAQEAGQPQDSNGRSKVEFRYETYDERRPDGSVERRTIQVPVKATTVAQSVDVFAGRYPQPMDAESQKLMSEEQTAAQEARGLSANIQAGATRGEDQANAKQQLREKLAQIFDLQQTRRNREIAKIEERLGKLKDIVKKREAAKDSIVDRRLETLTGGVDELGWEESFPTHTAPRFPQPVLDLPSATPVPSAEPRFAPPAAPRAGSIPNAVPPSATAPVAPAVPTVPSAASAVPAPPATAEPLGLPVPVDRPRR